MAYYIRRILHSKRCLYLFCPKNKENRKRVIIILGALFCSCLLIEAVRLELWVAKHKVGYLNDPCELSRDKLDQLRTVVIAYTKLLEEMNQTYWLDFGTLLGAHRCNDVLPYDGDADISRLVNWTMREDKIFVAKLGVRLEKAIGAKLTSYTLSYKDVSVDIFTWQRNNYTLKNLYKHHGDQPTFHQDLIFPLKRANFSGHLLSVPNKMTSMLKFRYPLSGPSIAVSYKWRCYIESIITLGFRPPRCPQSSPNHRLISEAVQNITKTAPITGS